MDITLEQYQHIQDFLDGAMNKDQASAFLQELKTNKDLSDSYEFEKQLRNHSAPIREAMEIAALNDLPDAIDDLPGAKDNLPGTINDLPGADTEESADDKFFRDLIKKSEAEWKTRHSAIPLPVKTDNKGIIRYRWATAAAACLVLAIGSFVLFRHYAGHPQGPAELFAAYFKKDAVPTDNYPMLAQALTDYNNNKFTTFQKYDLEDLPTLKGADDQRQKILELGYYYRGISWLATGDPNKAQPDLQWVIDHAQTPDLVWKAQWYQALALIKLSNIPAATGLLQSVSSNQKAIGYNQQAAVLLDKLTKNQQ